MNKKGLNAGEQTEILVCESFILRLLNVPRSLTSTQSSIPGKVTVSATSPHREMIGFVYPYSSANLLLGLLWPQLTKVIRLVVLNEGVVYSR
jgi:hypothetical protein